VTVACGGLLAGIAEQSPDQPPKVYPAGPVRVRVIAVPEANGAVHVEGSEPVPDRLALHANPAGALTNEYVPLGAVLLIDHVIVPLRLKLEPPELVHAGFGGELGARHGSMPFRLTVAVGEPVEVVKVQLPVPGAFAIFRLAVMFTVV